MTTTWKADAITTLLQSLFVPQLVQDRASSAATGPASSIDVILTFDQGGVSGHPNHISLYHGARAFASSLIADIPGWRRSPVDVYTLTSVPIWRKYASFLDIFTTLATASSTTSQQNGLRPPTLISTSALWGRSGNADDARGSACYATARNAMTTAHKSQMVWFRWGWIGLSRYMVINDLRLEKVKPQ